MNKPDIILFTVSDSLRYDACYPGVESVMPYLSSCSTHFHQARSPACWTLPSHVSMFSGLWPHEHKANTQIRKVTYDYPVLAERLRKEGYHTVMVTTNVVVTDIFGVNRGFDETIKVWEELPDKGAKWLYSLVGFLWRPRFRERVLKTFMERKIQADVESLRPLFRGYAPEIFHVARKKLEALLKQNKKKIFMFINLYDTHFPYQSHDTFSLQAKGFDKIPEFFQLMDIINNSHMRRKDYQPNMKIMDIIKTRQKSSFERIGPLFDSLARWTREQVPDSTVIFSSDHGENFGEEKWLYHFANVTEGGNKVPLLWSLPGQTHRSDIHHPVNLRNVYDSLCFETGAGPNGNSWHLTEDPEKSLSVIQAYWYDANGKTAPQYKRNQFAFNTEDEKFVFRDGKWHTADLDRDSFSRDLPLCPKDDPIQEAHLPADKRKELSRIWKEYREFEIKVRP